MNETQKSLIYLLRCAVNGITPDKARVQAMDMEKLYKLAKKHSVQSAVCIALERAGVEDSQFNQAYNKSVRKNIYLDIELKSIAADFERQGIWYMPLKGSVLKEIYPEVGMRQMADNDILVDKEKRSQVREIMEAHGYTAVYIVSESNHDVYEKPPVLSFEMHTALFSAVHSTFSRYYSDVKRRLIKDEDSGFAFHFSDEDFYVYMTAHEWKHYKSIGTGIRSLMDCYVYVVNKGDTLDWEYITKQTEQLGISDFEQKRRKLALRIFSDGELPELSDDEMDMLMFYLTSGAYGTLENGVKTKLQEQNKFSFWLHSIFLSRREMALAVPFTAKSPLLYPIGVIWRCFRTLIFGRYKIRRTIGAVKKYDKKI